MARLLLHITDFNEAGWRDGFAAALPGHEIFLRGEHYDPKTIDYIFIWKPRPDAFDGLSNLKAVLSFGAGVDALLRHPGRPRAYRSCASSMRT
jgi:glyoxylate/hydroxypyruvate reductase A